MAWTDVCQPTRLGGLGIKNLRDQGLALRIRWEWLRRIDPSRPWQGLALNSDPEARVAFDSLVSIVIGDGREALFWRDRWILGRGIMDIAPNLSAFVHTRAANSRTVA